MPPGRQVFALVVAAAAGAFAVAIATTAEGAANEARPIVSEPVVPNVFDGDLRSLPVPPELGPNDYVELEEENEPEKGPPPPPVPRASARTLKLAAQFSTAERSFDGIGNTAFPPDPNGDVGPNHYIQMVNSRFQVYDKNGNGLLLDQNGNPTPRAINQLWKNFGGLCETTNRGDPVVLYDPLADRWMLSQFAFNTTGSPPSPIPPYEECIAVSKTGDPVAGGWYLYDFNVQNTKFPDYPHFGVWPDAYYMSTRQLGGLGGGNYAFDRVAMLSGQAAGFIYFDTNVSPFNNERLVPTDLDGSTPPPSGTPNPFLRIVGPNTLEIWAFDADWGTPGASTFGLVQTLATAAFDLSVGTVPQPGTAEGLEVITDRLMHRIAYRNFGSSEAIVAQNVVDADGTNHAGARWYELRRSGGSWSISQQGTYAPDADHRWNPSIAMDRDGNIALGYSVTGSVFPSIRYAGRLTSDPAGTLPQGEGQIVAGSASQIACPVPQGNCRSRWGDYSSMSVDPTDDCTFWYSGEYIGPGASRRTRIGAFRFCNDPPTAHAGGPYVTDEGTGITLDGTGSTDPNPTDSLTYEWDLDNDGTFETSGATPFFADVGQDGVFTIRLRVTDSSGASDTDTTTVTVHNVAPTILASSNAPVNENSVLTVTGQATDPGWEDILAGVIDWGDGSVQPLGGTLENTPPDATLTFSVSHTYGDDGIFGFGAKICVADDDTAPCIPLSLQVDNVAPTAVIDLTGATIVNGIPTILGKAGQPVDFHGRSTDPGSDDLTLTWDFGDGPPSPDAVVVSLVNPPFPDPDPSPTIQPRDVKDDQTHVFGDACVYTIHFTSDDDDSGHGAATANVLIQGTADEVRNAAYWKRQYGGQGQIDFDQATLQCYLAIAGYVSGFFDEQRDASTLAAAFDVLTVDNGGAQLKQFDAQLLAALLNFANGGLGVDKLPVIAAAEAVRLNPASTSAQILQQRKILQALNLGHA